MKINEALKIRRLQLGISQDELARYIGFKHRSSVSRFEAGKNDWNMTDVLMACELLGLNLTLEGK